MGSGSSERLLFAGGGFSTDDPGSLLDVLAQARARVGADAQLVHYLAVPPVTFAGLTKALGAHKLADGARVVYEKPFGTSPEGFRALNRAVHAVLDESQVYRIDHFLGKEGTQNLHVLRFANELFAAMWSREHIESVQIDVPETLGITDRRRVLRRHRRGAGHAGHPPVPGRGRGRDGAAGEPRRRRPAGRPGEGHPLVPAAGPGRGRARPVRRATATCRA